MTEVNGTHASAEVRTVSPGRSPEAGSPEAGSPEAGSPDILRECVSRESVPQAITPSASPPRERRALSVGVFYDGNYYQHVTNHYAFEHPVASRLSLEGLHGFVRERVAELEGVSESLCRVNEAHYFCGRLAAEQARERDCLYAERVLEERLMKTGIQTHYLPLSGGAEKGVDVAFAMEAYEAVALRGVEVAVLVTGDRDYLPLVRKMGSLGARVMVLGWRLTHHRKDGGAYHTGCSSALTEAANYPLRMDQEIEEALRAGPDSERNSSGTEEHPAERLFPAARVRAGRQAASEHTAGDSSSGDSSSGNVFDHPLRVDSGSESLEERGRIVTLKSADGYGFIAPLSGGEDVYFCRSDVVGGLFEKMERKQFVDFRRTVGDRGPCAVAVSAS